MQSPSPSPLHFFNGIKVGLRWGVLAESPWGRGKGLEELRLAIFTSKGSTASFGRPQCLLAFSVLT